MVGPSNMSEDTNESRRVSKKIGDAIETTSILISHRLVLTPSMIRDLLYKAGISLPDVVSITVHVPGGGDWSDEDLEINKERGIVIEWKEEKRA